MRQQGQLLKPDRPPRSLALKLQRPQIVEHPVQRLGGRGVSPDAIAELGCRGAGADGQGQKVDHFLGIDAEDGGAQQLVTVGVDKQFDDAVRLPHDLGTWHDGDVGYRQAGDQHIAATVAGFGFAQADGRERRSDERGVGHRDPIATAPGAGAEEGVSDDPKIIE